MKIALYGGSFNPVHQSHLKVASFAIDKLKLDKLFFIPAYKSPFKVKHPYAPIEHRIKMLELVKIAKSEISLFEANRKGVSYTFETVNYFVKKYPEAQIYLLIGTDQLAKLDKWKNIDQIAQKVKLCVIKRDKTFNQINLKKYHAMVLNNPLYPGSSSDFRKGDFQYLDSKVNAYIGKNYLYIKDLMANMLDAKRHKHSLSVADYAVTYAQKLGQNVQKAWVAGALHDITKCWTQEEHRLFLNRYNVENHHLRTYQLHALTGFLWIKYEYKCEDNEILQAVLKHTTLAMELSMMDKIIYAADKLCIGRFHPGIQKDRALMLENFHIGFANIITLMYKILSEKRQLSVEQKGIFEKWCKVN